MNECLIIEISKPRSMPFLVGTWYRPPNSPMELLNLFEDTIDSINAENFELYLLGDLNCNLLAQNPDANTFDLLNILDIYDLTQLITEATRITPISKSLIDLRTNNYPEKVTFSGVLPLGISDHSLVYIIRKSAYPKTAGKIIKGRDFKHFNEANFLDDLSLLNWDVVLNYDNPNGMWRAWVDMLMGVVNKHAPIRETRIGNKISPWITPNILQKMRTRDYFKKKFETTKDILNSISKEINDAQHEYMNMCPPLIDFPRPLNVVAPSLTHIFNKSLCTSIYPKDWKMANVTPIYKNGAKRDLNNYRPISVRIIHDQFYHYLTSNELLTNCQSGFRAKHSTVTSLLETTNKWSINIDNGLLNGVVFIDLKKAFDTIDHAILLDKLTHYGVDENTLRWFQSYLSGRTQRCCCKWTSI